MCTARSRSTSTVEGTTKVTDVGAQQFIGAQPGQESPADACAAARSAHHRPPRTAAPPGATRPIPSRGRSAACFGPRIRSERLSQNDERRNRSEKTQIDLKRDRDIERNTEIHCAAMEYRWYPRISRRGRWSIAGRFAVTLRSDELLGDRGGVIRSQRYVARQRVS